MFGVKHSNQKTVRSLECSSDEVSLAELKEGEKGIMTRIVGGSSAMRRLTELGLTPGCEVKMLRKCSFHGPVEIEVRGVSLALGYGLALKVFVQPIKVPFNEN
ncbi:MAG: ferrous iron transport protein A [Candidatus Bathyarchaeota archaeon]|nr:ferrous iron transport protein A [Candidatus Bathyarchaeota archaeon]